MSSVAVLVVSVALLLVTSASAAIVPLSCPDLKAVLGVCGASEVDIQEQCPGARKDLAPASMWLVRFRTRSCFLPTLEEFLESTQQNAHGSCDAASRPYQKAANRQRREDETFVQFESFLSESYGETRETPLTEKYLRVGDFVVDGDDTDDSSCLGILGGLGIGFIHEAPDVKPRTAVMIHGIPFEEEVDPSKGDFFAADSNINENDQHHAETYLKMHYRMFHAPGDDFATWRHAHDAIGSSKKSGKKTAQKSIRDVAAPLEQLSRHMMSNLAAATSARKIDDLGSDSSEQQQTPQLSAHDLHAKLAVGMLADMQRSMYNFYQSLPTMSASSSGFLPGLGGGAGFLSSSSSAAGSGTADGERHHAMRLLSRHNQRGQVLGPNWHFSRTVVFPSPDLEENFGLLRDLKATYRATAGADEADRKPWESLPAKRRRDMLMHFLEQWVAQQLPEALPAPTIRHYTGDGSGDTKVGTSQRVDYVPLLHVATETETDDQSSSASAEDPLYHLKSIIAQSTHAFGHPSMEDKLVSGVTSPDDSAVQQRVIVVELNRQCLGSAANVTDAMRTLRKMQSLLMMPQYRGKMTVIVNAAEQNSSMTLPLSVSESEGDGCESGLRVSVLPKDQASLSPHRVKIGTPRYKDMDLHASEVADIFGRFALRPRGKGDDLSRPQALEKVTAEQDQEAALQEVESYFRNPLRHLTSARQWVSHVVGNRHGITAVFILSATAPLPSLQKAVSAARGASRHFLPIRTLGTKVDTFYILSDDEQHQEKKKGAGGSSKNPVSATTSATAFEDHLAQHLIRLANITKLPAAVFFLPAKDSSSSKKGGALESLDFSDLFSGGGSSVAARRRSQRNRRNVVVFRPQSSSTKASFTSDNIVRFAKSLDTYVKKGRSAPKSSSKAATTAKDTSALPYVGAVTEEQLLGMTDNAPRAMLPATGEGATGGNADDETGVNEASSRAINLADQLKSQRFANAEGWDEHIDDPGLHIRSGFGGDGRGLFSEGPMPSSSEEAASSDDDSSASKKKKSQTGKKPASSSSSASGKSKQKNEKSSAAKKKSKKPSTSSSSSKKKSKDAPGGGAKIFDKEKMAREFAKGGADGKGKMSGTTTTNLNKGKAKEASASASKKKKTKKRPSSATQEVEEGTAGGPSKPFALDDWVKESQPKRHKMATFSGTRDVPVGWDGLKRASGASTADHSSSYGSRGGSGRSAGGTVPSFLRSKDEGSGVLRGSRDAAKKMRDAMQEAEDFSNDGGEYVEVLDE